jgi:hypothetical protein
MAVNLSPVGGVAAQFFTNTGAVLTGGKLYTYAAGTTTPQTTYTTSAGNVAWTNPIVLDAAGRVSGSGEIWITVGVTYKFVLKDSNDVLIGTYDNVTAEVNTDASLVSYTPAGTGAVTTTVQNKLRQYVSVKDFGAVGDNVTDDTAAIQAAITFAIGNSTTAGNVFFPSGTYKVTSTLTIPNVTNGKGLIYGAGAQIKATHNGVLFDNQSLWVSFRDITLSGPGKSNANSIAIQGTAYDWYLENVGIYDFQIGYRANGGVHLLQKCFFGGNGKCVWPSVFANIISIDSCYFSTSDYGLYVPNNFGPGPVNYVAQVCIYNTAMEVCSTSVYSVGINRLLVENSWFEQETVGSLVLTDTPLLSINSNYVNFPPSISFTSGFPNASRRAQYLDSYTGETFRNYSTTTQTSVNFDSQAFPNSGLDGISFTGYLAGNSYTNRILGGDNRISIDSQNFWPLTDMNTYLGFSNKRWQDGYIARLHPGDANVLWTSGSGSPEGAVTAPVGSLYTRTDGGANTTLYIKESGSGNTGWVAK